MEEALGRAADRALRWIFEGNGDATSVVEAASPLLQRVLEPAAVSGVGVGGRAAAGGGRGGPKGRAGFSEEVVQRGKARMMDLERALGLSRFALAPQALKDKGALKEEGSGGQLHWLGTLGSGRVEQVVGVLRRAGIS